MQTRSWLWGMKACRVLIRVVLLGSFLFFGFSDYSWAQDRNPALRKAQADYIRAVSLMKQGKSREALPLLQSALREMPENSHLQADYITALVWSGSYAQAVKYYESHRAGLEKVKYLPRNVAKAYFELKDYKKALALYEKGFAYNHSDEEAFKGIIYTSCILGDYLTAYKVLLYARQKRSIPEPTLASMQTYILKELGASSQAFFYAKDKGIKDRQLLEALKGRMAVERLKWDEYDLGLFLLENILKADPQNFGARCDYIVALRKKNRMKEILEQYKILEKSGRPIPYWVLETVADAHLYLRHPREAVKFYRAALDKNPPNPYNSYMGLFYTYTELRQWDDADQMWVKIDDLIKRRKLNELELHEALVAWGWYLIFQDKLEQAQKYFSDLVKKAGLNVGFRSGLAHTYYWRGWPRRALEEFRIAQNMDPKDRQTLIGLAQTLDALNYKYEARALAADLMRKYPTNVHVNDMDQDLKVEDMHEVSGDMRYIQELDGGKASEFWITGRGTGTVNPYFKIFGEIIRLRTRQKVETEADRFSYDRLAFGFKWKVFHVLELTQSVGFDYLTGRDCGSYTKLDWRPLDKVKMAAGFDSFSLDIPIRARVAGVKAKKAFYDFDYLESDLRTYGFSVGSNWFTDGNTNPYFSIRYDQNVYNDPDFKIRLGGEFAYDRYSKGPNDVNYFSPNHEYEFLVKPAFQFIHYHMYSRKWRSIIYTRFGLYKECNFDVYPVAGITYEQEIRWSKTFSFTWNVAYDEKVYDGKYVNVIGAFFTFKKNF
jgi:biofilm PGA synthesis protein PgaA